MENENENSSNKLWFTQTNLIYIKTMRMRENINEIYRMTWFLNTLYGIRVLPLIGAGIIWVMLKQNSFIIGCCAFCKGL